MKAATISVAAIMSIVCFSSSLCNDDSRLRLTVEEFTLENGMKFLVLERRESPTIATAIFFKVGSVDEQPGLTGISHLLEHMMFKGTHSIGTTDFASEEPLLEKLDAVVECLNESPPEDAARRDYLRSEFEALSEKLRQYVVKDEIWRVYMKQGARGLNASTSRDVTGYYCGLPSGRLSLWALVESERMLRPVFREFYSERDVVIEERRRGTDNNPRGIAYEQLNATAFLAHPYRWPVIGWESDIRNISRDAIKQHFRKYYVPNNAVAVVVGDVKVDEVKALAKKYFARIPRGANVPPVRTIEPPQLGQRRTEIDLDSRPLLLLGFHGVHIGHRDHFVLDIIEGLLSGGNTGRLERTLVREKKMAVSASASSRASRFPSLFTIEVEPREMVSIEELENAVFMELEKLKTAPPSERELQRVRNQKRASLVLQLDSNSDLAWSLGYYETIDSWRYLEVLAEKWDEVTPLEVMRVARERFTKEKSTVVIVK